jgi:tryptophan synthase alpha chain
MATDSIAQTDRIAAKFASLKAEGRTGLVVFVTVGHPYPDAALDIVPSLVAAGADAVELGIPFSEAMGEGPVIQESSFVALRHGVTTQTCLDAATALRPLIGDTPLILMGYYNTLLSYGLSRFASACADATVDGLIIVDLPGSEAGPLVDELSRHGIHLIPLLAPTSTDDSIAQSVDVGGGFVYCISVTGVTGARTEVSERGLDLVERVRQHTDLPIAVGFGISQREHVLDVGKRADAAVVGSALVRSLADGPNEEAARRGARVVAELAGRREVDPK